MLLKRHKKRPFTCICTSIYKYIEINAFTYLYVFIYVGVGTNKDANQIPKETPGNTRNPDIRLYSTQIPQKETLSSLLLQHTDSQFINENLNNHNY